MNTDAGYSLAELLERFNFGTIGTDIFLGQMPAETNGIYIVRSSGTLNYYNPIEETIFSLYVQNTKSVTAISTIENIKRTLHRHLATGTDNSQIYSILVLGDVEDLGRDSDYGKVYKISVLVLHRASAVIS